MRSPTGQPVRPLEDDQVDRPEVYARRRVQPTGTNRPRAWDSSPWCSCSLCSCSIQRLTSERAHAHQISGGKSGGKTPVPIPNTEVKTASADGTWGETPRESRSPPDLCNERPPRTGNACAGAFVALGDREERADTLAAMPRPQDRGPRPLARGAIVAVVEGPPIRRTEPTTAATRGRGATSGTRSSGSAARRARAYDEQLMKAADAYSRDHERDDCACSDRCAARCGLVERARAARPRAVPRRHYPAAAKELEAFVELSRSVEQHPVLIDCYRAERRWRKVDDAGASRRRVPGRDRQRGPIVAAGSLADLGRIEQTIALLTRADGRSADPSLTTCASWYPSPILRSGPATCLGPGRCSDRVRREDADSPTSPSAWGPALTAVRGRLRG